jgi:site-specific DNA recombinase
MYVAMYSRVSTDKQIIDGFGIDVQRKELVAEAIGKGIAYKEYTDMGITGTSIIKRKELQRLLEDVQSGLISEVWVTKLSRLGRNTRDVLNIIYEFEKNNVIFKSIRDGIDTSNSMGKVMLQFMSIVSEMERDIIMETTKAGLDYRASLGKIYGCKAVLGYDRIGSGKNSYLELNINESKTIKQIYNLYLKGYGYKAICNELNSKNIKTKDGNDFSINTIKVILSNPLYVGKIRYNLFKDWTTKKRKGKQEEKDIIYVDGLHENIISQNKWNKVKKRMKNNRATKVVKKEYYQLTGLMYCPECGAKMVGTRGKYTYKGTTKIYRYYVCSSYHNKGRHVCNPNRINAITLDVEVIESIRDYLVNENTPDKDDLIMEIKRIMFGSDLIEIKKLLRVIIERAEFDYKNKVLSSISFNVDEDLYGYLEVKYSEKRRTKILNFFDKFVIMKRGSDNYEEFNI